MKLYRKIKHNERMYRSQDLGSYAQGKGHNQVRGQKANLTKLHKKIKHNEKVCQCAQELGSYAQGQGHNQVRGQIVPKIVLHINY